MKILCFGDSNTYGFDPRAYLADRYEEDCRWVDLLARDSKNFLVNAGENGREIPHLETQWTVLNRLIMRQAPLDLLMVMLGTNDLLRGRSAEEISQRMERFLAQVDIPTEQILLIAPPALQRGIWVTSVQRIEESQKLSAGFRKVAQKLGVRFLDVQPWMIPLAFDGVHFTEDGHKIFASQLMNYLTKEFHYA